MFSQVSRLLISESTNRYYLGGKVLIQKSASTLNAERAYSLVRTADFPDKGPLTLVEGRPKAL
jgi:hypothetical protein